MDMIERLSIKLLARCARETAAVLSECLCRQPDERLIHSMISDIRMMLDEFEAAYFDDGPASGKPAIRREGVKLPDARPNSKA